MVAERFADVANVQDYLPTALGLGEFEIYLAFVGLYFNALDFVHRLDSALNLSGFAAFVAETLDEFFGLFERLALVPGGALEMVLAGDGFGFVKVVVARVRVEPPARKVERAVCEGVQKCPVVADEQNRARVGLQIVLEPRDGLDVQVVGRLVEHQKRRRFQKEFCEGNAHLPTARELGTRARHIGNFETQAEQNSLDARTQFRLLGVLEPVLDFAHFGNGVGIFGGIGVLGAHDFVNLSHSGAQGNDIVESRFRLLVKGAIADDESLLREIADSRILRLCNVAGIGLLDTRENFEQSGLARAVGTDQANAVALVDNGTNPIENRPSPESQRNFF